MSPAKQEKAMAATTHNAELWGRYQELRRLTEADADTIAELQRRASRAEVELENLKGDVYLYGIGEITRDQLLGLVEGD